MSDPGDIFLVRTGDFLGALIRLGTRSPLNHCGLFTEDPWILEATPQWGIRHALINQYGEPRIFSSGKIPLTPSQRKAITARADELVGVKYGFVDIAALTLRCTVGLKWKWLDRIVRRQDRMICSQFVAECYASAGITLVPGKDAQYVTPGDIALAILEMAPVTA